MMFFLLYCLQDIENTASFLDTLYLAWKCITTRESGDIVQGRIKIW